MHSSRPFVILALLIGGFALLVDQRHAIASGIQALATVAAGGTGLTTLAAHTVLIGSGTSPVNLAGPGAAGQCFLSNGAGADPTYQACPGSGGGGITVYSGTFGGAPVAGTYYVPIGGGLTASTTEANVDVEAPSAATITNFYVQLSTALGAGNTGVFTWRKAGASQSLTCTITGAVQTSCNDLTHSFTAAQGDLLDVQLVTTGTIVVNPNAVLSVQFGTTGSNGTVNTGTSGQIGYYAANGTAMSGETLIGNANYYGVLASHFIATDESTMSATLVALTTADTVTFTLAATTSVFCSYAANSYSTGSVADLTDSFFVDGSQADDGNQQVRTPSVGTIPSIATWIATSLTAASHTIAVRHSTTAGTAHWRDRGLACMATP